jgi:hypothetical protein
LAQIRENLPLTSNPAINHHPSIKKIAPPLAALLALAAMASTGATAQTATQTSDPVGCLESLRLARQSDDEEHAASPECIEKIETYYALKEPRNCDGIWMNPKAEKQGDSWVAKVPVRNVDDCVFAFAIFTAGIPSKVGKAVAMQTPQRTPISQRNCNSSAHPNGKLSRFPPRNSASSATAICFRKTMRKLPTTTRKRFKKTMPAWPKQEVRE